MKRKPETPAQLRIEHRRMRAALSKIMNLYATAPGMANPLPTTKLVYGMYTTALKAVAQIPPR